MKIESYKDCMRLTSGNSQKASKLWAVLKDGDSIDDSDAFQQLPTPQVDVDGAISRISSHVEMNLNDYKRTMTDEMALHLDSLNQRISQYGQLFSRFISEYPSENKIGNGGGRMELDSVKGLCKRCMVGYNLKELKENNGFCPECGSQLLIRGKGGVSAKLSNPDDGGDFWLGLLGGCVAGGAGLYALLNWDELTTTFDQILQDIGFSSPRYSPRSSTRRKSSYRPVVRPPTETKEIPPLGARNLGHAGNKLGAEEEGIEDIDSLLRMKPPEKGASYPFSE